jgi:16S rRNA processing protein RimM
MTESDCFILGKITKPHGYKGEVVLFIDADEPDAYLDLDAVWLKLGDRLIPHFIESIRPHNTANKFVVRFDGIETEEQAKSIAASDVLASLALLPELDATEFYLHEVDGWEAVDAATDSQIGTIKRVLDYAMYPILEVDTNGTEVLIPLPAAFEIKVDREAKTLTIELPEGLLEAYLGGESEDRDDDDVQ